MSYNLLGLVSLKILSLNGNNIGDSGARGLSKLLVRGGGISLYLRDNVITNVGYDALDKAHEIAHNRGIPSYFDVEGNNDIASEKFVGTVARTQSILVKRNMIRALQLQDVSVNENGILKMKNTLQSFSVLGKIKMLYLQNVEFGPAMLESLSKWLCSPGGLPNLTLLSLRDASAKALGNGVDYIATIAESKKSLKTLEVIDFGLNDEAAKKFRSFNPTLLSLNLKYNDFGHEGFLRLCTTFFHNEGAASLKEINFEYNELLPPALFDGERYSVSQAMWLHNKENWLKESYTPVLDESSGIVIISSDYEAACVLFTEMQTYLKVKKPKIPGPSKVSLGIQKDGALELVTIRSASIIVFLFSDQFSFDSILNKFDEVMQIKKLAVNFPRIRVHLKTDFNLSEEQEKIAQLTFKSPSCDLNKESVEDCCGAIVQALRLQRRGSSLALPKAIFSLRGKKRERSSSAPISPSKKDLANNVIGDEVLVLDTFLGMLRTRLSKV